jgi:hypothetical protein
MHVESAVTPNSKNNRFFDFIIESRSTVGTTGRACQGHPARERSRKLGDCNIAEIIPHFHPAPTIIFNPNSHLNNP